MKRWIPVIILFLLALGGVWFWSLGSVPDGRMTDVALTEISGRVEVRLAGRDAWAPAELNKLLPQGAQVRTGEDGEATVSFYGLAESRIAPSSDVTLDALRQDPSDDLGMVVRLKLATGRVWSRVLRLMDIDSGFSVETSDAVATVRGTAFDVAASDREKGTTVWVSDSVVDVADGYRKDEIMPVPDATMLSVLPASSTLAPLPADVEAKDWVRRNRERDRSFREGARGRLLAEGFRIPSFREPDSLGDRLTRLSESWHLRMRGVEAGRRLAARYAERRLMQIRMAIDDGKIGAAFNAYSELEDEFKRRLSGDDASAWRPVLRSVAARALLTVSDVPAKAPAYRLKQRLEDLLVAMSGTPAEALYARLIAIDARIDEARAANDADDTGTASDAVRSAAQGLENAERDAEEARDALSADHRERLLRKRIAAWARLKTIQVWLDAALSAGKSPAPTEPSAPSATSTVAPLAKPTPPPAAPSTQNPPPPASSGLPFVCASVDVFAQPNPVDVGGRATLFVRATKPDGSTADVTSAATFRLIGSLGTLARNVFTANAAGTVQIQASVVCDGKTVSGQMSLQINAGPVVPKALSITASPATIGFFERSALSAVMTYSNGVTKNVTASVSYTSSNPAVGTVSGRVFSSGQTAGSATVSGSYAEAGVTVTDATVITVTAPQSTKP